MTNEAGAPRRRLKLKNAPLTATQLLKDRAGTPAEQPGDKALRAAKRQRAARHKIDEFVARAVEAKPSGFTVTTTLQGRHYEWLQAIARLEGRTLPQMLERLVRIGYSQDHGKARSTGATQVGSSPGGDGHSGSHPARGSE